MPWTKWRSEPRAEPWNRLRTVLRLSLVRVDRPNFRKLLRPPVVILSEAKDLLFPSTRSTCQLRGIAAGLARTSRRLPLALLLLSALCPAHAQQQAATPPPYTVLLDAAHGGAETGARLTDQLEEKDLTLALSVRLRSILTAHGIQVLTTREYDADPSPDTRAAAANRTHAAACLLLHATTSGTGVHLYTAALAPAAPVPSRQPEASRSLSSLRPWATAQAAYLIQSLKLSSDVSEALAHAAIPVTLGSVSLAPIDTMACPAVILEVAPLLARRTNKAASLSDSGYQTRLLDAVAGALEQWRTDWTPQP